MVASWEISKMFRMSNSRKPLEAPSQKGKGNADQGNKNIYRISSVTLHEKGIGSAKTYPYDFGSNKM